MIRPADPSSIAEAARLLKAGQLVGMPTETVYGLAADAFNAQACAAVFEVKERPAFDPLIVHILGADQLERVSSWAGLRGRLGDDGGSSGQALVALLGGKFWPGPLTLVLPKAEGIPDIVCAGLPTVAVRVPSHPVARALLEAGGAALAGPAKWAWRAASWT